MATQPSGSPDSSVEPSPESSLECLGSFVEKENARVKVESRDIEAGEQCQDELDNLVHWDGPDDPRNPMNWSDARKWLIIGLISLSSFNTYVCLPSFIVKDLWQVR